MIAVKRQLVHQDSRWTFESWIKLQEQRWSCIGHCSVYFFHMNKVSETQACYFTQKRQWHPQISWIVSCNSLTLWNQVRSLHTAQDSKTAQIQEIYIVYKNNVELLMFWSILYMLHFMFLEAISSQLNTVCVFSAADTESRLNIFALGQKIRHQLYLWNDFEMDPTVKGRHFGICCFPKSCMRRTNS